MRNKVEEKDGEYIESKNKKIIGRKIKKEKEIWKEKNKGKFPSPILTGEAEERRGEKNKKWQQTKSNAHRENKKEKPKTPKSEISLILNIQSNSGWTWPLPVGWGIMSFSWNPSEISQPNWFLTIALFCSCLSAIHPENVTLKDL